MQIYTVDRRRDDRIYRTVDDSASRQLTPVPVKSINLGRTDAPIVKVHRAGELEKLAAAAAKYLYRANYPVITAWVVVDIYPSESDVGAPKTIARALADLILANANGLLGREAAGRTVAVAWESIARRVTAGESVTRWVASEASVGRSVTKAIPVARKLLARGRPSWATVASRPDQVEGVAFRTAVAILNSHDGCAPATGIADHLLPASAVNSLEPEVRGVVRHPAGALETAPLRRLAGYGPQDRIVSAHLHFGDAINHHLDGAFTFVGAFTTPERGSARLGLSARRQGEYR